MVYRLLALAVASALSVLSSTAMAAQGTGCLPTTGTISGLQFAQDANAAIQALISSNSGASAPSTDCSGTALAGQLWLDTSISPNILKQYDGEHWLTVGYLDGTNAVWTPPVGGGAIATVASAATVDLGLIPQAFSVVTGTATISSFGSSATVGTIHYVKFAAALTLTYNSSSMILPGAADIATAAGDVLTAVYLGGGNWQALHYQRANGTAVVNPARDVGDIWYSFRATAPDKAMLAYGEAISRSSYPDFLAAVTITQTATRVSGSATLTAIGDMSQVGPGMPVEGLGIPAGTTISSNNGASLTISNNATSSGSDPITIFTTGYGSGGDSSTVGVPDCRGYSLAGRPNMGGTNTSALTQTYFGAYPYALNAAGGSQSVTLGTANLPPYTPSGTVAGAVNTSGLYLDGINLSNPDNAGSFPSFNGNNTSGGSHFPISGGASFSGSFSGNAQGGSSAPFSRVGPTRIANCFIRVLP